MNYKNENITGIDLFIGDIQDVLYKELSMKWGNIDVFGRVYKNKDDDNKNLIPEVHVGSGEYKQVYINDKSNASIFFVDSDNHTSIDGFSFECDLNIVFMINLSKTFNTRKDALAQNDVITILKRNTHNFRVSELKKGLDNVLSEFKRDKLKFYDMQPNHIFSVQGKLNYYFKNSCNG